jgi:hypothetical protein
MSASGQFFMSADSLGTDSRDGCLGELLQRVARNGQQTRLPCAAGCRRASGASEVSSAEGKQQVIAELYEKFFRIGFKKQAESLGIVYTPVEVVDFILRAADTVSREHFGCGLTDESVHILDAAFMRNFDVSGDTVALAA